MSKDYFQDVRANWRRIIVNRALWIFGLFAIANNIFPNLYARSELLLLRCVGYILSIFILALSAIGRVGLIHIADNVAQKTALSFKEIWKRSARYFPRVIVIDLILGLILVLPFMCFYVTSGLDLYQNTLYSILYWAISILAIIISPLSTCAIVIDKLGIANSLSTGVRVFMKRPGVLIILGATFLMIPMIIAIGSFIFLNVISPDVNLPSPISVSIQTYSEIVRIGPIAAILPFVNFLILPLWIVLITQLYKDQTANPTRAT